MTRLINPGGLSSKIYFGRPFFAQPQEAQLKARDFSGNTNIMLRFLSQRTRHNFGHSSPFSEARWSILGDDLEICSEEPRTSVVRVHQSKSLFAVHAHGHINPLNLNLINSRSSGLKFNNLSIVDMVVRAVL